MAVLLCCALLLLLGVIAPGHQSSLEEIVNGRLLTGFREGCDAQAVATRSLSTALKAAHKETRMREGNSEAESLAVLEVREAPEEDNSSFSRNVMSFRVRPFANSEDGVVDASSVRGAEERCLVTRLHLKRVGVSVFSLAECPLINLEVDVAVAAFQQEDCISFVERDSIVKLHPTYEGPPISEYAVAQQPAEPAGLPYWLEVIGADRAWASNSCAREVVVGVIDTGIACDHPDLRGNMWHNELEVPGNGLDDDKNGYIDDIYGYDFFSKKAEIVDAHGHGTHVAGIIGAVPIATSAHGVCKTVSIAALRFMDEQGSGATSDAIEAINYAIEMDFHMTNNSWGGPGTSAGLLQAIQRAAAVDQLFVAAAGNSGNSADLRPEYPGAYKVENVISVAATDEGDRLANFSNYGGASVHIAAPGVFIVSTYPPATTKSLSGTSMAAPVISGVAAMLLSVRPMQPKEIKEILFATAERPRPLKNKLISSGRVSAAFALCMASKTSGSSTDKEPPQSLARRLKKHRCSVAAAAGAAKTAAL